MNTDNTNQTGQAGAGTNAGATSAPGGSSSVVSPDSLTLKEINEYLGKEYKDKDSALKSFKDTFSFVGKKIEPAAAAQAAPSGQSDTVIAELAKQVKEMRVESFYTKNPQYDTPEYREVISKMGENPAEIVGTSAFKTIFEKASGYDNSQKKKTVLESNPRIGQARDKATEAKQQAMKGDPRAIDTAVGALVDILSEKKR